MSEYYRKRQVIELLEVDDSLLTLLEEEHIVSPVSGQGYAAEDVERIRVARALTELGVNGPGIEVALRLREQMLEERRELVSIIEALKKKLDEGKNGL